MDDKNTSTRGLGSNGTGTIKKEMKSSIDRYKKRNGFTLVEIMVVVVILSLLAMFAAPEFAEMRPKSRLKGAAKQLFSDMQNAKTIALKDNANTVLTVASDCPEGSYIFSNGVSDDIDRCITGDDDEYRDVIISSSTIAANDGFTTRALSILGAAGGAGGGTITVESARLQDSGDPTYTVILTGAGGVQFDRVLKP